MLTDGIEYRVGRFTLKPFRQLLDGGTPVAIGRKALELLSVLAKAEGALVTKDELMAAVWPKAIVEDNAIQVHIAALRKTLGRDARLLETVRGLGYRLDPGPPTPAGPDDPPRHARQAVSGRQRAIVAGVVAVGLVVALAGWAAVNWRDPPMRLATPVVEVRPLRVVGVDPALRSYGARATDAIAAFLGSSEVRVVSSPSTAAGQSTRVQLAFGGVVSSGAGQTRLHLVLNDLRSGTELWSADYTEPAVRADALIDEAKGGAIETINLIRPGYGPNGLILDPETNRLGLRAGLETVTTTAASGNDALADIEQAVARDPNSGLLRGAYAIDMAGAGMLAAPSEQADLFKRARAEAERTIREHYEWSASAYTALMMIASAQAPRDWIGNLARTDATLKASPEDPYMLGFACQSMRSVGRAVDGLHFCQRALALLPHSPPFIVNYAMALDMTGDRATAGALLDEGVRLHPNFADIRKYRFFREAWNGSPDAALAMLHDPFDGPRLPPAYAATIELVEHARKSGRETDADAAMAAMRNATQHAPQASWRFLVPMALGRLDDAFGTPDIVLLEVTSGWLESAPLSSLRRDRRFWPLAAKAGFVRYWLATDKWPDFCRDPSYPFDCRAEARRVSKLGLAGA